jgi:Holliday junction resolvase
MELEFGGLEVEDIMSPKKRKGIKGGEKGKRCERLLCKILTDRFGQAFNRSVGSGNRWSQVSLSQQEQKIFSGDLVSPENFRFVIESKGGYSDIDFNSVFVKGNSEIDGFISQAEDESSRCGRKPLIVWKRNRQPWLAFLHSIDLKGHLFDYKLMYKEWTCVALEHLLRLPDDFFFNVA